MSPTPGEFMSEAQWQARVVDYARWRGWRVWHHPDSRRTNAGWPDLTLLREHRLVLLELKTSTGTLRAEQRQVLDELAVVTSVTAHIARPADWTWITETLR